MEFKNEKQRDNMISLALSFYVGEVCPECEKEFSSIQDLKDRDPKWIGNDNPDGKICCKECFEKYMNKQKERKVK